MIAPHSTRPRVLRAIVSKGLMALALAPACVGLRPPVRNSGPAVSREGVQVAVTGQECTQVVETEQPGNDLVEAILEVQVRNASTTPLTVHRDAFRLVTPDGYALKTSTWRAIDPLTLGGGETRAFELRFMTRGSLQCSREMRLDADAGMILRDHPVDVGGVRFVPWRAL